MKGGVNMSIFGTNCQPNLPNRVIYSSDQYPQERKPIITEEDKEKIFRHFGFIKGDNNKYTHL